MKKILISKQSLSKTYSGACRSVHEEIKFFKRNGHEVHTIAEDSNDKDIISSGGIPHKSFRWFWQKKINRRLQFSRESKKLASKLDVDLLIGHGDLQEPDVHFIHNCVHLAHEKIHGRALSPENEMYKIHTPIFKNKQFKHLVANSIMVKDELIKRFSIPENDISVIYPAVDESQFKPLPENEINQFRESLDIDKDHFLVGLITSGNFKKRGVDRFLSAINSLDQDIAKKTTFLIVGKDKLPDEFQIILENCKHKERVKFMSVTSEIAMLYNALDIFVLPARIEEFGRVVAEAMACGAPVITTKWVGASELMLGESREFIYDGEKETELTALMSKLLRSSDLRKKMSDLNRQAIQPIYESKLENALTGIFQDFL